VVWGGTGTGGLGVGVGVVVLEFVLAYALLLLVLEQVGSEPGRATLIIHHQRLFIFILNLSIGILQITSERCFNSLLFFLLFMTFFSVSLMYRCYVATVCSFILALELDQHSPLTLLNHHYHYHNKALADLLRTDWSVHSPVITSFHSSTIPLQTLPGRKH